MIDLRKNIHPVEKLIQQELITLNEVLEFAQQYMDAMDAFDDERLRHSEWECSEGTLHTYDDECHCREQRIECENELFGNMENEGHQYDSAYFDYYENYVRPTNPEYLLASTWWKEKETLLFASNQDGEITSLNDYGGIAERWGSKNWDSHHDVVNSLFGVPSYKLVWERKSPDGNKHHALYKRQYDVQ